MASSAISKSCRRPWENAKRRIKGDYEFVTHEFNLDEADSFHRELSVFSAIRRIPVLAHHAPVLVHKDLDTRTIVLRQPNLFWIPLHKRAKKANLSVSELLRLEEKLRIFVTLAYKQGVAYRIRPNCILLVKKTHTKWTLFLGGWGNCAMRGEQSETEWSAGMMAQFDEIKTLFEPLKAHAFSQEEKIHGDVFSAADAVDQLRLKGDV